MLTHCFLWEFQGGFLIACLCDVAFQNFVFMIDGPPKVVPLAVDLHENLVQMPAPATGFHAHNSAFSDLRGKHRAEPVPPISHRFMANIDAAFVQKILDISTGQGKTDVQHHRQADYLSARFKIAKWVCFDHLQTVRNRPARFKSVCSDSTPRGVPAAVPFDHHHSLLPLQKRTRIRITAPDLPLSGLKWENTWRVSHRRHQ